MTQTSKTLGEAGEENAERFLKKRRYRILCRNYRCAFGEIDIVAQQGRVIAFVEVKTRRSAAYGAPQDAVLPHKQRKISRVAQEFIQRHRLEDRDARFDVVAVRMSSSGHTVDLIKYAFELAAE